MIASDKLLAVQVLRSLDQRGGSARTSELGLNRAARRDIVGALQLAAREGLVTSRDGGRSYTLTAKAHEAIALSKAADLDAPEVSERYGDLTRVGPGFVTPHFARGEEPA